MSKSNIVDFRNFKEKKKLNLKFRGRKPLHTGHSTGKLHGNPYLNNSETEDFGNVCRESKRQKKLTLLCQVKSKGKSHN